MTRDPNPNDITIDPDLFNPDEWASVQQLAEARGIPVPHAIVLLARRGLVGGAVNTSTGPVGSQVQAVTIQGPVTRGP